MPEKILVRAPNWLGDAVMCGPFLKRLRAKKPGAEIHVLCRPGLKELFEGFPGLDGTITLEAGEPLAGTARRLRSSGFGTGYVLPPSFSSALLFFLAGVPERIGYAGDFRRFLLTRALPLDERFHYVRRYLGLLGEAGRDVSREDFYFPGPKDVRGGAKSLLSSQGVRFGEPVLAVAPGSQAPARRWMPDRFAALINGLSEKEWPTVCLLGAPGDASAAQSVERNCRRPVLNLCGKTSLTLLGEILRASSALVTNESGMMHAAWAVGTPTVVLAGPSEPRATSPFGARVKILQRREVPCVPCVKNDCYRPGDEFMECLKRISVEEVREALDKLTGSEF